jgi:hypothetical protein
VPDPGELRPIDRQILEQIEGGFASVGEHLEAVRLRAALGEAMGLARAVNGYLDRAPWFSVVKQDKAAAATTVYTALRAIDSLKVLLAPFLPFSSEKLHVLLGYEQPLFGELKIVARSEATRQHETLALTTAHGRLDAGSRAWRPVSACSHRAPVHEADDLIVRAGARSLGRPSDWDESGRGGLSVAPPLPSLVTDPARAQTTAAPACRQRRSSPSGSAVALAAFSAVVQQNRDPASPREPFDIRPTPSQYTTPSVIGIIHLLGPAVMRSLLSCADPARASSPGRPTGVSPGRLARLRAHRRSSRGRLARRFLLQRARRSGNDAWFSACL